ncbi:MAG: outer rane efflux protein [Acidobacteria bacterium]|nr:outer rane efflux protein [Acidobacteriota bacterium]
MKIRKQLTATLIVLHILGTGSVAAQQQPSPAQSQAMSLSAATSAAFAVASAYQQAQIDEATAAEDLRQAHAAFLPALRSTGTFAYNSPAKPPAPPNTQAFIAQNAIREYQAFVGIAGSWSFGMSAAARRARALLEAAHAGTEVARRALARGVAEAYYGAAVATEKQSAAADSLAAAEEFERVTRLSNEAGEVPEADLIRARLQTAQRREDLAQAIQVEVVAYATLGAFLGRILNPPAIEPLPQIVDVTDVQSLRSDSVQRRPEFARLDAQVRAARHDIRVARADILPKISYSLDRGFDTPSFVRDELRQHVGNLAMVNIDIPIFDWGMTRSKIRQARLRAKAADLQRQITTGDLRLQFATARQQTLTAAERVDNARRALADAERNVTISIARYRAGEAPILEATDALTTRAQQRILLQQALFDYQVARARLQEASGL